MAWKRVGGFAGPQPEQPQFRVRNSGPGGARVAIVPANAKAAEVLRFAEQKNCLNPVSGKWLVEVASNSHQGRYMELSAHDIRKIFCR